MGALPFAAPPVLQAEHELGSSRNMVALTYIRKRKGLLGKEPTKTIRNTYLAIVLVAGLSAL
tara:strand:+ start:2236 stop:2421 length:186 start_codon:yes stop_codon:yes gene_type:complete